MKAANRQKLETFGIIIGLVVFTAICTYIIFYPRPPPEPGITVKYFGDYPEELIIYTDYAYKGTPLTVNITNLDNNSCYFFFIPGMETESSVKIEYTKERIITFSASDTSWLLLRDDGILILALYINAMVPNG